MNATMLQQQQPTVKSAPRFVPPVSEYEAGRTLYRRGKRLSECVSDEMAAGWLDAEQAGYMAYSRHMEAEGVLFADAFAFVNWNGGAQ